MFLLLWWLRRFCQPNSLGLTKNIKNIAHSSHKAPVETLCKELQVFQLRLCAGILHQACKELPSTLNSISYENQHWQWVEVGYSRQKEGMVNFTTENGQSPYGCSGLLTALDFDIGRVLD